MGTTHCWQRIIGLSTPLFRTSKSSTISAQHVMAPLCSLSILLIALAHTTVTHMLSSHLCEHFLRIRLLPLSGIFQYCNAIAQQSCGGSIAASFPLRTPTLGCLLQHGAKGRRHCSRRGQDTTDQCALQPHTHTHDASAHACTAQRLPHETVGELAPCSVPSQVLGHDNTDGIRAGHPF